MEGGRQVTASIKTKKKQMKRYDMLETQKMDRLLTSLPPTADGILPFKEFEKRQEWQDLVKTHSVGNLKSTLTKRWNKRFISVEQPKKELNHAYNFCPSCGFKLN